MSRVKNLKRKWRIRNIKKKYGSENFRHRKYQIAPGYLGWKFGKKIVFVFIFIYQRSSKHYLLSEW